ncbi:MAG TPA: hypothetical protein ENK51_09670 [Gammaproteobacteria bacterium]|nr:hypothetical protein [Gammaproteobacteria bacterium]
MKMQKRDKRIIKNAAGTGVAAVILAAVITTPAVSAMPSATAHVLAHPPTTGDCTTCHPKPIKPKRNN